MAAIPMAADDAAEATPTPDPATDAAASLDAAMQQAPQAAMATETPTDVPLPAGAAAAAKRGRGDARMRDSAPKRRAATNRVAVDVDAYGAGSSPSRRKATSFARVVLGDRCADGGCVTPKTRKRCAADNVGNFDCDLRTLKVPSFYAASYAAFPEYQTFAGLTPARRMLLHVVNARKMIQKAAPILTVCTPFVCDSHLLHPNVVSQSGHLLPLYTAAAGATYAQFIPSAPLEQAVAHMRAMNGAAADTPAAAFGTAIAAMKMTFGVDNVKRKPKPAPSPLSESNTAAAVNLVSNPYLPLCVPPAVYGDKQRFVREVDAGDGRTALLNEPIFEKHPVDGKPPIVGEAGRSLVPEKYQNEPSKYYRMGKGYLLSAFEHLRAAAIMFGRELSETSQTDPEYGHLTPEQYNMLYWAYATISVAAKAKPVYGPAAGPDSQDGRKVFKGRILKFEDMTDYVVYHVFAELLVRYAVAESRKSQAARKYDAQKSVSEDNARRLVEIRARFPMSDLIGNTQAFVLVDK